jgi:CTP synthase (UTP-ammonia lyase)
LEERVELLPGTRAAALYGTPTATESYMCSYGVGAEWQPRLEEGGLRVTARSPDGDVRIVELAAHPFLVATLFLPQMRSAPGAPHPIIAGFVDASGES